MMTTHLNTLSCKECGLQKGYLNISVQFSVMLKPGFMIGRVQVPSAAFSDL